MCTDTVLESKLFDIVLTRSSNYLREYRYVLRYGLEVGQYESMVEGVEQFDRAVRHALSCEGYIELNEEDES